MFVEVFNSIVRIKFFMRIWELFKWEDVLIFYEILKKGKWKIIDNDFDVNDFMENGCIDYYGDFIVCIFIFYINVNGFEKINEYLNLNDLLNFIYWKNLIIDDENINKNFFINIFKYFVIKNLNK